MMNRVVITSERVKIFPSSGKVATVTIIPYIEITITTIFTTVMINNANNNNHLKILRSQF